MMEFHVDSYTGEILNKTCNHLYIKPSKELEHVVAHYTITFQNNETIPEGSVLHLIPDVSGCLCKRLKNSGMSLEEIAIKTNLTMEMIQ
ncbi:MAG: hypothetical protein RR571_08465, partial [Anaerorhabdus sp.]